MTILKGAGPHDERFEALFRKHYARVWRYFRTNSISDDEAHDLAQDAFTRLLERMDSIRNEDAWPFLAAIAKTVLLNRVRSRKTQKRSAPTVSFDDPDLLFAEPAAAERDTADRLADKQRWDRVIATVETLPAGQRECFRLWIEGLEYEEIATILGITVDAVKSRLRDAKRTLRQQLGEK